MKITLDNIWFVCNEDNAKKLINILLKYNIFDAGEKKHGR